MAPPSAEPQATSLPGAPPLSAQEFALFQGLIYREAGILPAAKRFLLARRLSGRGA